MVVQHMLKGALHMLLVVQHIPRVVQHMNTNARGRLLDTGRVLSFQFSQPSVRAGSPCDHSLSHGRGGYFVANETPGPRVPFRTIHPPGWRARVGGAIAPDLPV